MDELGTKATNEQKMTVYTLITYKPFSTDGRGEASYYSGFDYEKYLSKAGLINALTNVFIKNASLEWGEVGYKPPIILQGEELFDDSFEEQPVIFCLLNESGPEYSALITEAKKAATLAIQMKRELEVVNRKEKQLRESELRLANERAEYERLKKQFGGTT